MAKRADQEPSDLRTMIATRLGKITNHGLSAPAVRQSGLPDLLTPDWDLAESVQFITDVIACLASEIVDERRLLAVLAALRIPLSGDGLGDKLVNGYIERAMQWDHGTGIRQRVFESQQAWIFSTTRDQVHTRYFMRWSDIPRNDRPSVYYLVKDYWYDGRDELADLLIDELERTKLRGAPSRPTRTVEAAPLLVGLGEQSFRPPQPITHATTPTTFARPVHLSKAVEEAVDAAVKWCEARKRDFYTPDLLLVLLDVPSGRVADCFDAVWPGLANDIRKRLAAWTTELTRGQTPSAPELFKLPAVQYAEDLVVAEHGRIVNEVHLLLGVLNTESTTRQRLARYVDIDRLGHEAYVRRNKLNDPRLPTDDPSKNAWPDEDDGLGQSDEDDS